MDQVGVCVGMCVLMCFILFSKIIIGWPLYIVNTIIPDKLLEDSTKKKYIFNANIEISLSELYHIHMYYLYVIVHM